MEYMNKLINRKRSSKFILTVLLAVFMAISFAACADGGEDRELSSSTDSDTLEFIEDTVTEMDSETGDTTNESETDTDEYYANEDSDISNNPVLGGLGRFD